MLIITIVLFGIWIILKDNSKFARLLGPLALFSLIFLIGRNLFIADSILTFLSQTSISLLFLSISCFLLLGLQKYQFAQLVAYALFLFSAFVLQTPHSTGIGVDQASGMDPNAEFLIEIDGDKLSQLDEIKEEYGLTFKPAFSPNDAENTNIDDYYTVDIPSKYINDIAEIKEELNNETHVKWIEPNEEIVFEFPQKTSEPSKGNAQITNDPSVILQWHIAFLQMDKYYQLFTAQKLKPTQKAKLFILDTGIASSHEDLPGNHSGFLDSQGHGTHCAGVAGAITNNSIGIASMSPNPTWIDIKAIQVIGNVGFGTQQQIIAGIIKATDQGADVISMSLGGITNQDREKAYNDAVSYANSKGAIVVVAAGNANLDGKRYSPANAENVISVASIQKTYQKSGFSNHVQNLVMGVCAPGENILSTTPSNTYATMSGTSMATPQVAGLIAVMKAIRPDLSTREVYNIFK